jgi:mRNA interferase YafQ
MFTTIITTKFKRDVKRYEKQGKNMFIFKQVAKQLAENQPLASKYKDHSLTGNWKGHRDCHLEPD